MKLTSVALAVTVVVTSMKTIEWDYIILIADTE